MTKRTYGGPLVDVAGAVDLHCHPFPDLFPRLADDFDIVRAARDAGMKAILIGRASCRERVSYHV